MDWYKLTPANLPPEGEVVHTKIDDEGGVRNETTLKRKGNLFSFLMNQCMCIIRLHIGVIKF